MSERRKDPFVHLPANVIFTREGLAVLSKSSAAIRKVSDSQGVQKEGLASPSYNAPTMQKMIMNSYLEELYVSLPDLLRKRFEIISTSNLIVYAVLYKKLTPSLAKMLFDSPVVKEFNRKNPRNSMVDLKHVDRAGTEKLLAAKAAEFSTMRDELHEIVNSMIWNDEELSGEDKEVRIRSLPKFIAWIDNRIWYLYYIIYQTPLRAQVTSSFAKMLAVYLNHTRIGVHLSNLLMEFIQNAEKAHLERVIVRNNLAGLDDVDKYLRDSKNRLFTIEQAQRDQQMLEVSWHMNSERSSIGQQYRIRIRISNYGLINEKARKMLSTKMQTDVEGISLADFYQDTGDGDKLGAGLGLLYNSYLQDICREEGIAYKCNIFPEPQKEKTTVTLELAL